MPRQFVAVRFKDTDTKTYTYHNDGQPIAKGERVKVPAFRGDGWLAATVVDDNAPEPTTFKTKAILGLVGDGTEAAAKPDLLSTATAWPTPSKPDDADVDPFA